MATDVSALSGPVSRVLVENWPAGITPPADGKPFKVDGDVSKPPKLWWE